MPDGFKYLKIACKGLVYRYSIGLTHPDIDALGHPFFTCGGKASPQPSPKERECHSPK